MNSDCSITVCDCSIRVYWSYTFRHCPSQTYLKGFPETFGNPLGTPLMLMSIRKWYVHMCVAGLAWPGGLVKATFPRKQFFLASEFITFYKIFTKGELGQLYKAIDIQLLIGIGNCVTCPVYYLYNWRRWLETRRRVLPKTGRFERPENCSNSF